MEQNKLKLNKEKEFKIPRWMDCSWKRISCGEDSCPVCGKIKREREKHIKNGEDPNDIALAITDLSNTFKKILKDIKKDAKNMGVSLSKIKSKKEPPAPYEFFLFNEIKKWRDSMFFIIKRTVIRREALVYTEAFDDFIWYADLLPLKTYRQLCNKWEIENGEKDDDHDYVYTKYVLDECLKFLKEALAVFMFFDSYEKHLFIINAAALMSLEEEIKNI